MLIAGLVMAVAVVAVLLPGRRSTARRLAAIAPPTSTASRQRSSRRIVVAAGSGVAGLAGFGLPLGLVVGGVAAAGIILTGRNPAPESAVAEDVAVVTELLAGCLAAGLSMADALAAAAVAGDPVTAAACQATATALRRGEPAALAWQAWQHDGWLAPVGRCAQRSTQSGAAAADDLQRAAGRLRARRRARLQQRVQRASVWVVVPLGLCFLPAFVLVAVVPLVAGLFGSLH